jgi:hypothetical protein
MLALAGCSTVEATPAPEPAVSSATPTPVTTPVTIEPSEIVTIEDGIAWARSIDETVTAEDLRAGVQAIAKLVPTLDLGFKDNNSIGAALIELNAATFSTDPAELVDDLNAIVDDIEAALP